MADDQPAIRKQLRSRLDAQADVDVVGTAWSGMEALRLVHQLEPDVLVVDHDMDDVRGVEVAAHLGFTGMNIRVVLYTIRGELLNDDAADGSDPAHSVLDEASIVALMAAIRRPPRARLAARAN